MFWSLSIFIECWCFFVFVFDSCCMLILGLPRNSLTYWCIGNSVLKFFKQKINEICSKFETTLFSVRNVNIETLRYFQAYSVEANILFRLSLFAFQDALLFLRNLPLGCQSNDFYFFIPIQLDHFSHQLFVAFFSKNLLIYRTEQILSYSSRNRKIEILAISFHKILS